MSKRSPKMERLYREFYKAYDEAMSRFTEKYVEERVLNSERIENARRLCEEARRQDNSNE